MLYQLIEQVTMHLPDFNIKSVSWPNGEKKRIHRARNKTNPTILIQTSFIVLVLIVSVSGRPVPGMNYVKFW